MRTLTLSLYTLLLIVSSCKIEKRRYQPGYYIEFNGKNRHIKAEENRKKIDDEIIDFDKNISADNQHIKAKIEGEAIVKRDESNIGRESNKHTSTYKGKTESKNNSTVKSSNVYLNETSEAMIDREMTINQQNIESQKSEVILRNIIMALFAIIFIATIVSIIVIIIFFYMKRSFSSLEVVFR